MNHVDTYFLATPKADFKIMSVLMDVALNLTTLESLDRLESSSTITASSSESYFCNRKIKVLLCQQRQIVELLHLC